MRQKKKTTIKEKERLLKGTGDADALVLGGRVLPASGQRTSLAGKKRKKGSINFNGRSETSATGLDEVENVTRAALEYKLLRYEGPCWDRRDKGCESRRPPTDRGNKREGRSRSRP